MPRESAVFLDQLTASVRAIDPEFVKFSDSSELGYQKAKLDRELAASGLTPALKKKYEDLYGSTRTMATKEQKLKNPHSDERTDLKGEIQNNKAEIAALKAELQKNKDELKAIKDDVAKIKNPKP
jgi:septal ring factor EnvC (AmiA/AmiB activator)